jgi:hypothetical protein
MYTQCGLPYRYHQHTFAWMVIYYIHSIRNLLESITVILICILIFNMYFKSCIIFKNYYFMCVHWFKNFCNISMYLSL